MGDVRLRLRYPEYFNGHEQKAEIEDIFRATGFDYDFAFPGAQFALPDGFWIDLIVTAAKGGAATAGGAIGLGLTKATWRLVTEGLHALGRVFKRGQVDVHVPERAMVTYEIPEGKEFDPAVTAMESDYELNVEDVYTVRHWSPEGSCWEVTWRHKSEGGKL